MTDRWSGTSRVKPSVTRWKTPDGMFALRIVCWHGAQGEVAYPDRDTVASWEQSCRLNPCRWVPACPEFRRLLSLKGYLP